MRPSTEQTTSPPTGNTYDKYASKNPVERYLMKGFMDSLRRLLPDEPPSSVLEVGIGEAEVAAMLAEIWPEASIVGLDLPDPDLADHWRGRSIPAAFGDAHHLPFPTAGFDLVIAIEVLEHVEHPRAVLREIERVTRRDVLVSVPREPIWRVANMARGKYLGDLGNTPGHINHWSSRRFVELVTSELDVTDVARPFPWTMVAAVKG